MANKFNSMSSYKIPRIANVPKPISRDVSLEEAHVDATEAKPRTQTQTQQVRTTAQPLASNHRHVSAPGPAEIHANRGRPQGRPPTNYNSSADAPLNARRRKRDESPTEKRRLLDTIHHRHHRRHDGPAENEYESEDETPAYAYTGGLSWADRHGGEPCPFRGRRRTQ